MRTISAKTILSGYADSGWFGASYNMNLYKGCCHGCIYCDSRSACYRVENFDEVRAKRDALSILERELRSRRRAGIVHTGAMSDPYNPFEEGERLTQGALRLLDRYGFGVVLATKSPLGRPGRGSAGLHPFPFARGGKRHHHHGGRRAQPPDRAACPACLRPP